MILDILKAYQANTMPVTESKYVCKYCNKGFTKETTLVNHLCEKKRRYQQEKEKGVQWGFMSYLEFYKMTQSSKEKTYDDFVTILPLLNLVDTAKISNVLTLYRLLIGC
jgi:hypothetical protein